MFPVLILSLLALQDRPEIQGVESLTGRLARSGCWLPLKVRLASPLPFEGDLTATGDTGIRVTRSVRLPAGGTLSVILPVIAVGPGAKIEVVLRGPSGEVDRRPLAGPLEFLGETRLVLVDPAHTEAAALQREKMTVGKGTIPVRFVPSDPVDWNEAADMGALEIVDAVVASDRWTPDLTMNIWRGLGGALVTQPRRELPDRLGGKSGRFPAVDPASSPFRVNERWIPAKRESAMLFIVVYAFAFFVAVYVTWARKGSPWLLTVAAVAAAILFVAAYGALVPKGNVAIRVWQVQLVGPESPVAISVCVPWGPGEPGDLEFGRLVKPVHPTIAEATMRDLELRVEEGGRCKARGVASGSTTRFVVVERAAILPPAEREGANSGELEYFRPVFPLKGGAYGQAAGATVPPAVRGKGIVEVSVIRAIRIEVTP